MRTFLFFLAVVALANSCEKEWVDKFWQTRLDGKYDVVDVRTVKRGPDLGIQASCFSANIFTEENELGRFADMTGYWNSRGEVIDLNIKFEPTTVIKEDGTVLNYTFGIFEGKRELYQIIGTYEVTGFVPSLTGEMVEYKAKGTVDMRKVSR